MLTVATFNVNSIKARLDNLTTWLREAQPDIVLLQELRCEAEKMPRLEIESLGYSIAAVGQKSHHGVAILAKGQIDVELRALPGDESDTQARYIQGWVTPAGTDPADGLRVASIYLPNGNPIGGPKFAYKLSWMDRLQAHARDLLAREAPAVLGGDYNCAPFDTDVWDTAAMADDALVQPETRQRFRALLNMGLTDAFRAQVPERRGYSYWDYQGGRFERDEGLLIDFLLLTPSAADRLAASWIDTTPRGRARASDHTPVCAQLAPPRPSLTARIAAQRGHGTATA